VSERTAPHNERKLEVINKCARHEEKEGSKLNTAIKSNISLLSLDRTRREKLKRE